MFASSKISIQKNVSDQKISQH
uniref:Uncharacterized protein n=1 Tax=Rhizophora mucronata TaxID=61149 RepID=A0A2P2QGV6_RHIMU